MRWLLLAGAIFLAGCSGAPGPKMAELTDLQVSIPVRLLWQASVGTAGDAILSPVLAGGAVYAAAEDGTVARFDAATGQEAWRVKVDHTLSGGVGSDGSLLAVGTFEGEAIALDAATGAVRWRMGMVAERGNLLTGFAGGKLVSIALANGGVRWEATVALPRGATELERVTDVVGVPVVAEREVCAVAFQGRIGCFDGASGNPLWSREMSSAAGLSLDARYVFVSDDKGAVQALDRGGGATIWKQDRLFLRRLTAPLAMGDVIAVGDVEGYLHFLSRESGAFVGRASTDGNPIRTSLLRLDQGFLVQNQQGNLYAVSLR